MKFAQMRRLAWHDVTCPEGQECRDRDLHAGSSQLVNLAVLDKYYRRLMELRQEEKDA